MRRFLVLSAFALALGAASAWGGTTTPKPQDVTVPSGDVTLAARLYLPAGTGPFPAMVITHGSGPAGRNFPRYQEEAKYFVAHGIACLTYDKRGNGDSTGDWRKATFEDLAGDIVALVEYLKSRPDIDAHAIGLRGASQSGWILPIAASRSKDISYLVLVSPAGVTPYEQILYNVRTSVEDAGYDHAAVVSAVKLLRSGLDYARTGKGWDRYAKLRKADADKPWFKIAAGPPDRDDWLWKWIHPLIDYDVIPLVRTLKIPVLVLLGEEDREVPSQVAGYRFSKALQDDPYATVRYFPNAGHDLRSTKVPNKNAPLAPGYLESIKDFVLDVARRNSPSQDK